MKTRTILLLAIFIAGLISVTSCSKEGSDGRIALRITVSHNFRPVPDAKVGISYGAEDKEADITKTADKRGQVFFTNLREGDYLIMAEGLDSASSSNVANDTIIEISDEQEDQAGMIRVIMDTEKVQ